MIRIVLTASLLCVAAPAFGQSWTHEGVTFAEKAGWCPIVAEQDDGAGGKALALQIQPCGKEFPMLSIGIGARGVDAQNIQTFTAEVAVDTAGDTGKTQVDAIFKKKHQSCSRLTYAIDNSPVRNLPAFQVNATYSCPGLDSLTYEFHNLTAYAQQKNGDLWVVAFDSPTATLSSEEEDLIRNAVAAINAR